MGASFVPALRRGEKGEYVPQKERKLTKRMSIDKNKIKNLFLELRENRIFFPQRWKGKRSNSERTGVDKRRPQAYQKARLGGL